MELSRYPHDNAQHELLTAQYKASGVIPHWAGGAGRTHPKWHRLANEFERDTQRPVLASMTYREFRQPRAPPQELEPLTYHGAGVKKKYLSAPR